MSIAFRVGFLAEIIFVLSNCATKRTEIEPQYVSHLQYTDFDCDQISEELQRISVRSDLLFHRLDKTASTDETQMAVRMILFWPTLF